MHKAMNHIAALVAKYPALFVGMLAGGALISAAERSLIPALMQGICALSLACTIKR